MWSFWLNLQDAYKFFFKLKRFLASGGIFKELKIFAYFTYGVCRLIAIVVGRKTGGMHVNLIKNKKVQT